MGYTPMRQTLLSHSACVRRMVVAAATAALAINPAVHSLIPALRAQALPPKHSHEVRPLRPFKLITMDPSFDRIIAPGTKLETIVTIPGVDGEAPVWRHNELWFSDQRGGGLYAVKPDGTYREVLALAGGPVDLSRDYSQGPNGEAQYKNGSLLFCRQSLRDIAIMSKRGKVKPFLTNYQGKRFNSPNDIVIGHDGTV